MRRARWIFTSGEKKKGLAGLTLFLLFEGLMLSGNVAGVSTLRWPMAWSNRWQARSPRQLLASPCAGCARGLLAQLHGRLLR